MAESLQIAFYIVSPIGTFLAVATAYYAIYRQTKPCVVVYYEPNPDTASLIDLVIRNIGTGTARDISFSDPLPILGWGIEKADNSESKQIDHRIPFLAPGKELRFNAGQYGGLKDRVKNGISVSANYSFRTPLRSGKKGTDSSMLDVNYMQHAGTKNSAAQDLSDALKGRNHTVFIQMNKSLASISKSLSELSDKRDDA
ncbi:hypothetical protein RE428_03520 [Marinobacter nanhaiticus D15-8W]|uniref:Uncharacterized protein n=1 Tax=Marinobacter nanhaiticus D15-8W TaxID=626887 RepID=N6VXH7_9GAMM|nr:hypothetical protein [Marinobacter nanhaiticus]ENO14970.1 hypothetical protein J057_06456 [Marinobacter nanhaiticus D15-8W]BES69334.1 hypothetical protein RE428_03520 [Marinobacter nanhaiticus D15-8W]